MSAPCQESACQHFSSEQYRLATRIVQILPAVAEALPQRRLRVSCRWHVQEGGGACLRCPQVITRYYEPSDRMIQAATGPPANDHGSLQRF